MKKLLSLFISFVLLFSLVFGVVTANGDINSGYQTIQSSWLNFQAHIANDGSVKMSRGKFDLPAGEKRHYWKVIRSDDNSNPVYPDDGYIKYEGNRSFSNYVDSQYKKGYYRVCAITSKDGQRKRYCSNVVHIDGVNNDNEETEYKYDKEKRERYEKEHKKEYIEENKRKYKKEHKKEYSTSVNGEYVISKGMKKLLDNMLNNFMKKLNEKYSGDIDGEIKKLETITSLFNTIKVTNPKTQSIFRYLGEKLEEYLGLLQAQQLLDV